MSNTFIQSQVVTLIEERGGIDTSITIAPSVVFNMFTVRNRWRSLP